jgi:hypothetical protein
VIVAGVPLGGGRFRIGPLRPGSYRVEASDGVNEPIEAVGHGTAFEVDREEISATITMDRGASIRGVVVDRSNEPIPDTWVSATCQEVMDPLWARALVMRPKHTMSDEKGQFELKGLRPDARCTVHGERPDGLSGSKVDIGAGEDVVVALTEAAPSSQPAVGNMRAPQGGGQARR